MISTGPYCEFPLYIHKRGLHEKFNYIWPSSLLNGIKKFVGNFINGVNLFRETYRRACCILRGSFVNCPYEINLCFFCNLSHFHIGVGDASFQPDSTNLFLYFT